MKFGDNSVIQLTITLGRIEYVDRYCFSIKNRKKLIPVIIHSFTFLALRQNLMMKKAFYLFFCLLVEVSAFAQISNSGVRFPQYINEGTIPEFSVVTAPDSTIFTRKDLKKDKPLLIMIFSPDCSHCQHETQVIEKNMEHFKDAQILMVTWLPYNTLVPFSEAYNTGKYQNIILAHDPHDFFYGYFEMHQYPKVIVYNKKGEYVSDYEGTFEIENVWNDLGGN